MDGVRWGAVTSGAGKGLEATHPQLLFALRFARAQDRMFSAWIGTAHYDGGVERCRGECGIRI